MKVGSVLWIIPRVRGIEGIKIDPTAAILTGNRDQGKTFGVTTKGIGSGIDREGREPADIRENSPLNRVVSGGSGDLEGYRENHGENPRN